MKVQTVSRAGVDVSVGEEQQISPERVTSAQRDLNQQLAQHLLFHQLRSLGCLRVWGEPSPEGKRAQQHVGQKYFVYTRTELNHRTLLDVPETSRVD